MAGGVGVAAGVMEQAVKLTVKSSGAVRTRKVTNARGVFMRETIPDIY